MWRGGESVEGKGVWGESVEGSVGEGRVWGRGECVGGECGGGECGGGESVGEGRLGGGEGESEEGEVGAAVRGGAPWAGTSVGTGGQTPQERADLSGGGAQWLHPPTGAAAGGALPVCSLEEGAWPPSPRTQAGPKPAVRSGLTVKCPRPLKQRSSRPRGRSAPAAGSAQASGRPSRPPRSVAWSCDLELCSALGCGCLSALGRALRLRPSGACSACVREVWTRGRADKPRGSPRSWAHTPRQWVHRTHEARVAVGAQGRLAARTGPRGARG